MVEQRGAGRGEDPALRAEAKQAGRRPADGPPRRSPRRYDGGGAGGPPPRTGDAALQRADCWRWPPEATQRRVRQQLLAALSHGEGARAGRQEEHSSRARPGGSERARRFYAVQRAASRPTPPRASWPTATVKEHFDTLVQRCRSAPAPPSSAGAICRRGRGTSATPEHGAGHGGLLRASAPPEYAGGPRALAQALEQVDLCIAQKQAQGRSLEGFLARYSTAPRASPSPAGHVHR